MQILSFIAFVATLGIALAVGAEPKAVLRSITVSGLKASCEQQQLSPKECQQLRSGYISGAYDALVAAQVMRNDWGAESAKRAERMLSCLRTQSREPLFEAFRQFETREEFAKESAVLVLLHLAEANCGKAD
jgi:hypothetical protein